VKYLLYLKVNGDVFGVLWGLSMFRVWQSLKIVETGLVLSIEH
jgi:hypothetical protein